MKFKILSHTKTDKGRCVRLFGFKIIEEISNEFFNVRKFLGNLVYTKKLRTHTKERKVFKVLGISISERIIVKDTIQYYLFRCPVKKIDIPSLFYKKYLKDIDIDYDDLYIIHANSGESFLFFAYCVKAFLNKNNSKKPLFAITKKYHADILKMYLPDANYIDLKNFYIRTSSNKWVINNHNCYIIFSLNHFYSVDNSIYKSEIGKEHYLNCIRKTLDISEKDYTPPIVKISQENIESLNQKINSIDLNLDNFVLIAPEAQTCEELDLSFWKSIVEEIKKRGFDIFLNILDERNYIQGTKTSLLNYQELFELTQKAKAVISLRSGLTEFVVPTNVLNITIYTKFRKREKFALSVEKTVAAYSMHKFPFVDHDLICELNIDNFKDEKHLLSTILETFDNKVPKRKV